MHVFSSPELRVALNGNKQYAAVRSTATGAPFRAITVRDTIGNLPPIKNGASSTSMEFLLYMSQVNYMKSKSFKMNNTRIQSPSSHRLPIPGPPGFPSLYPHYLPQETNMRSQYPTPHPQEVNSGMANGARGKKVVRTNDEETMLADRMMEVHTLRMSGDSDEIIRTYEKAAQVLFEKNDGKILKLKTNVEGSLPKLFLSY